MSWSKRRVYSLEVWPQLIYSNKIQELPKVLNSEAFYLKVLINPYFYIYRILVAYNSLNKN